MTVDPGSIPPLVGPATGSANPAASLTSLWSYIQPAADHMVRAPTNTPGKAPALAFDYHMGIHTAVYNYFTTRTGANGAGAGSDFYELLDGYFGDVAREALLGVPEDERLVQYLLPCFQRYSAGAGAMSRLLNYTNRQFVKRAIDEDRGWLRLADVIEDVAEAVRNRESHSKLAARLRARRDGELVRWGWDGSPADVSRAEAAAEAASPPDRVVPLASLAHRRFRTEIVEPLLKVPKAKKKNKGKAKAKEGGGGGGGSAAGAGLAAVAGFGTGVEKAGPKGRLARAVKVLLEGNIVSPDERLRLVRELFDMLRAVGVPPEQPLCRKLAKVIDASATTGT
ncbi:hypothetical protein K488DRAFT_43698 [Vararia minispora EC-137]|uniref:Uncharacterized protein n=1 Tax=Vararia minispora EC-137 TaxID=1314806 RepID=A0ACB8QTS6_9AGAM|nr:hypothetical protein K488DRAFT_43698 [Vararia minispora EC-137]